MELILDLLTNLLSLYLKITSKKNKNKKESNIGNFGSVTKIPSYLKNIHLVASTDGVGTKIEIANALGNKFNIGTGSQAIYISRLYFN